MKLKFLFLIFLINTLSAFCQDFNIKPYKVLKGHKQKVQGAFFSKDGKFIISYGWDNTVKIWDARTFTELRTFKGHTDQVWHAALSYNNKLLASGSMDRTFIIWDIESGRILHQIKNYTDEVEIKGVIPEFNIKMNNSVYRVQFSPDGKQLAIASADKLVRIWDVENSVITDTLDGKHLTNWMWCRYSPDGKYLISASSRSSHEDGVKVIWETGSYRQIARIVMSGSILFTDNNELGIYTGNNSMNYYDLSDGTLVNIKSFPDYKGNFNISPDKKYIVSCNEDSFIILRNIQTQDVVWTYQHDKFEIHSASFSPDGKYLIAGTPEGNIFVWEMKSLVGQ